SAGSIAAVRRCFSSGARAGTAHSPSREPRPSAATSASCSPSGPTTSSSSSCRTGSRAELVRVQVGPGAGCLPTMSYIYAPLKVKERQAQIDYATVLYGHSCHIMPHPAHCLTSSSFSASDRERLRRSRLQAPLRRGDTSVCSKEVAHSHDRVNDVVVYAIAPKRRVGRTSGLRLI